MRVLLSIVILAFVVWTASAQSRRTETLEGTVVGHQVVSNWSTNMDGYSSPLLLRTGSDVGSMYIVVLALVGLSSPEKFRNRFPLGAQLRLSLERDSRFDKSGRKLLDVSGFKLLSGSVKESLPRSARIPWYLVHSYERVKMD